MVAFSKPLHKPGRARERVLAALGVTVLLSFSPTVGWLVSREYAKLRAPLPVEAPILPPLGAPGAAELRAYAAQLAAYESALGALKVSNRRRLQLLENHFALYRRANSLFGAAQAGALTRMLTAEVNNQQPALGRRSVFSSPEAAQENVDRWLTFSWQALHMLDRRHPERLARQLGVRSPAPLAAGVVFKQARWIRRAASAARLPPAVLAAIVDNEQAGTTLAWGLSGLLRDAVDTAALRTSEVYGRSGLTGELSNTVGVTQMSWQDALHQAGRLGALKVHLGVPFPTGEPQARELLARPYANLLLAASRLRGYLNHTAGLPPNSAAPHMGAWAYYLAPGWHNNPALASSGQTWPYAWNAFFKACLYQRLLPEIK